MELIYWAATCIIISALAKASNLPFFGMLFINVALTPITGLLALIVCGERKS